MTQDLNKVRDFRSERGPGRRVSKETREAMYHVYKQNASLREVCEQFRISFPTVKRYMIRDQWETRLVRETGVVKTKRAREVLLSIKNDVEIVSAVIHRVARQLLEDESKIFEIKDLDMLYKLKLILGGLYTPDTSTKVGVVINNQPNNLDFDAANVKLTSEERIQIYKILNRSKEKTNEAIEADYDVQQEDEDTKEFKQGQTQSDDNLLEVQEKPNAEFNVKPLVFET